MKKLLGLTLIVLGFPCCIIPPLGATMLIAGVIITWSYEQKVR